MTSSATVHGDPKLKCTRSLVLIHGDNPSLFLSLYVSLSLSLSFSLSFTPSTLIMADAARQEFTESVPMPYPRDSMLRPNAKTTTSETIM